jgi:hypothetical protein
MVTVELTVCVDEAVAWTEFVAELVPVITGLRETYGLPVNVAAGLVECEMVVELVSKGVPDHVFAGLGDGVWQAEAVLLGLAVTCVDTVVRELAEGESDELGVKELTRESVITGLLDWQAVEVELTVWVAAGLSVPVTEITGVPE